MKKIIVFYVFVNILFSCKKNDNEQDKGEFRYSIPVRIDKVSDLNVESIASLHSIIPLETPYEIVLGRIEQVFLTDSLLFTWDSKADVVIAFDYQGNYKYSIGRKGQGPAEYVDLSDVYFDKHKKRFYLSDIATRRILQYDIQGNFLASDKINEYLYSIVPYNQGYFGVNAGQNPHSYDLIYLDNNAKIQFGFFPLGTLKSAAIPLSKFTCNDDGMFFYASYRNGIYKIEENHLSPYIHIDFGEKALPYTNLQPDEFLNATSQSHYLGQIHAVYSQNNSLFFSFLEYEGKNIISRYYCYTSLDTINPIIYTPFTINHAKELVVQPTADLLALSDSMMVFQIIPNILPNKLLDKLNQYPVYGNKVSSDSNPILVLYKLKI